MHLLNFSLGQFVALFGSLAALMIALYLLDRARRRQVVSTLRFWTSAAQPEFVARRRRIRQPWSLVLQLVSVALLLLAIAQLRLGIPALAPRGHVLILETSAWMAARPPGSARTLMQMARDRARAYVRSVPQGDPIMLLRADALTTPATAFDPDHDKLRAAIAASAPGATALNLEEALAFARRIQEQSGQRPGEIVFVGTGRLAARETAIPNIPNLRVVSVPDALENCGLRRMGVRRSTIDSGAWDVYISLRNYSDKPRAVALSVSFGPSANGPGQLPIGAQRMTISPGSDREATFQLRSRAAGFLVAQISPHDGFPADDRAVLELPSQRVLHVAVYSNEPDLLRPVLAADTQVAATFRSPAEYRSANSGELVMLDRFRPAVPPQADAIWIDPPAGGSPVPVRERVANVAFTRWLPGADLGLGLRTRDFRLASASIFEASPDDVKIGEVEGGPVIVARPGKPKLAVLGFHPALSAMRYELAAPLLFANLLRWMAPEVFRRRELNSSSVGAVKVTLDADVNSGDLRVVRDDGQSVPFTVRDRSLEFFSGTPGTVRVTARDREYVYSLTLPQLWESQWTPPAGVRRGVPRSSAPVRQPGDLWQWLALAGGAGLFAEWLFFGRRRRMQLQTVRRAAAMRKAS